MDNDNRIQIIKEKLSQPGYININNRMEIANLLDGLDPETANKIIEQFPEVKDLAIKTAESIKDANDKILKNNESSFTKYYEHSNVALDAFISTYKNPNATQEEKKFAAENMQKILDRDDKKDDKVRENNNKMLKTIGIASLLSLGIALVSLGGKISFKPDNGDDNTV